MFTGSTGRNVVWGIFVLLVQQLRHRVAIGLGEEVLDRSSLSAAKYAWVAEATAT